MPPHCSAPYCILYFAFTGHVKVMTNLSSHFPRLGPLLRIMGHVEEVKIKARCGVGSGQGGTVHERLRTAAVLLSVRISA